MLSRERIVVIARPTVSVGRHQQRAATRIRVSVSSATNRWTPNSILKGKQVKQIASTFHKEHQGGQKSKQGGERPNQNARTTHDARRPEASKKAPAASLPHVHAAIVLQCWCWTKVSTVHYQYEDDVLLPSYVVPRS